MKLSTRRIKALLHKDLKDFFKNPSMVLTVLVPLLFILFYRSVNLPIDSPNHKSVFLLNLGLLLNITLCTTTVASTSIAEEKEKNTLRTLILSNVKSSEFFLSKILVSYLITMLTNVIIFFLAGVTVMTLPIYLLTTTLGAVCMLMISCVIGILSRDQMTCGVYQVPIMMFFLLPPVFAELNPFIYKIARFTPLNATLALYYQLSPGADAGIRWLFHLVVLLVWIVISTLLFSYFYKKKGRDN